MIKKKTLLILGAGASAFCGYPSGPELMRRIIGMLKKEDTRRQIEEARGNGICRLREFQHALPYSGQLSIDGFLQYRPEFADYGKAAIAHILLRCENMDSLFELDPHRNWYLYLFNKMTDGGAEYFRDNQLKVVTFNYDTSLETFFYWALRNSFKMKPQEVMETMQNIEILHVHGRLSHIPWEQPDYRKYGEPQLDGAGVRHAASQLHIIHEDIESTGVLNQVANAIEWAEEILILGFGYHPMNMKRLNIPWNRDDLSIHGTTFKMTDMERRVLASKYQTRYYEWAVDPKHDILSLFRNCYQLQ